MKKITPNPPETAAVSDPTTHTFTIAPNIDSETLLAHACETLASGPIAFHLDRDVQ